MADLVGGTFAAGNLVAWAKAFALTEAVEAPIYRWGVPCGWGVALGASAITHPFVWFAFPVVGEAFGLGWGVTSIVSEIFAFGVEAVFVRRACGVSWRRAAGVSLLANGASVGIGLLLRATTGLV